MSSEEELRKSFRDRFSKGVRETHGLEASEEITSAIEEVIFNPAYAHDTNIGTMIEYFISKINERTDGLVSKQKELISVYRELGVVQAERIILIAFLFGLSFLSAHLTGISAITLIPVVIVSLMALLKKISSM